VLCVISSRLTDCGLQSHQLIVHGGINLGYTLYEFLESVRSRTNHLSSLLPFLSPLSTSLLIPLGIGEHEALGNAMSSPRLTPLLPDFMARRRCKCVRGSHRLAHVAIPPFDRDGAHVSRKCS